MILAGTLINAAGYPHVATPSAEAAAPQLPTSDTGQVEGVPQPSSGDADQPTRYTPDGSGAFRRHISLTVPDYFSIAPALALDYNSQAGNGPVGLGWALTGLSTIEATGDRGGSLRSGTGTEYRLDGKRLLPCTEIANPPLPCLAPRPAGTSAFIAEPSGPDRIWYEAATQSWTRTQTNGTEFRYTPVAKAGDEGDQSPVYTWAATTVTDVHGHSVSIEYREDAEDDGGDRVSAHVAYPIVIYYADTRIDLYWQHRPDLLSAGRGPDRAITTQRLAAVDETHLGKRVRAFALAYTEAHDVAPATLSTVSEFGRDATVTSDGTVSGLTSRLLGRFDMSDVSRPGWGGEQDASVTWPAVPAGWRPIARQTHDIPFSLIDMRQHQQWVMTDLDGDGRSDLVGAYWDPGCTNLRGGSPQDGSWVAIQPVFSDQTGSQRVPMLQDKDRCTQAFWKTEQLNVDFYRLLAGDLDGDGRGDILLIKSGPTTNDRPFAYPLLSRGDGTFIQVPPFPIPDVRYTPTTRWFLADVNGDSRQDLVAIWPKGVAGHAGPTASFTVGTSYGSGQFSFHPTVDTTWKDETWDAPHWFVGDLNADGRTDVLRAMSVPADQAEPRFQHPEVDEALAGADGVLLPQDRTVLHLPWSTFDYPVPPSDQQQALDTVQSGDFDGDGRLDLAFFGTDGDQIIAWTALTRPGSDPEVRSSSPRGLLAAYSNFARFRHGWPAGVDRFPNHWFIGDFDGNGTSDIGIAAPENFSDPGAQTVVVTSLSNGRGEFEDASTNTTDWLHDCWAPRTSSDPECARNNQGFYLSGDVNGDGQSDLMFVGYYFQPDTTKQRIDIGYGVPAYSSANAGGVREVDADGDGQTDLVHLTAEPGHGLVLNTYLRQTLTSYSQPVRTTIDTGQFTPVRNWQTGDFNGDGRTDLVYLMPDPRCPDRPPGSPPCPGQDWPHLGLRVQLLLSNGDGTWEAISDDIQSAPPSTDSLGMVPQRWLVGDIDGDGRSDLVLIQPDRPGLHAFTLISAVPRQGDPRHPASLWTASSSPLSSDYGSPDAVNWQLTDLDGDGRADLAHVLSEGGQLKVDSFLSDGDGSWTPGAATPLPNFDDSRSSWRFLDLNGDGRSDLIHLRPSTTQLVVDTFSGRGDGGFTYLGAHFWSFGPTDPQRIADLWHWTIADVDANHRADLIHLRTPDETDQGGLVLDVLSGDPMGDVGYQAEPVDHAPPVADGNWHGEDVDLNGSDDLDHIAHRPDGLDQTMISSNAVAAAIRTATGSNGDETTVQYGAGYTVRPQSTDKCQLPIGLHLQVVEKVAVHDGVNSTADTLDTFYTCPQWSPNRRGLLGFSTVSVEESTGDADAHYYSRMSAVSHYLLTDTCRSLPLGEEIQWGDDDEDSNERSITQIGYSDSPGPGTPDANCRPRFLSQALCDKNTCSTHNELLDYDGYGNVTSRIDTATNADAVHEQHTDYVYALDHYVVALPRHQSDLQHRRSSPGSPPDVLQSTTFCYDNEPAGLDCNRPPVIGLLTGTATKAPDGHPIITTTTYDAGGRILTTHGPGDLAEDFTYDVDSTNMPKRACDALHHCTTTIYDPVTRQPNFIDDPNGARTSMLYDPLGRLEDTTNPDGGTTHTDYIDIGTPGRQHITTHTSDGTPDGLWTTSWLDGLGRTIRIQREDVRGPDEQDFHFDGLLNQPVAVSHWYRPDHSAPRWERLHYDALDRVVDQIHPDGTRIRYRYRLDKDQVTLTTTDEMGHDTSLHYDGLDRLISTTRMENGTPRTATYTYDALNRRTAAVDVAGNRTVNVWNSLGLESSDDADQGKRSYTYFDDGQVHTSTDARNILTTFHYDPTGRMTSRTRMLGKSVDTARWHYDEKSHGASIGRLTSTEGASADECRGRRASNLSYDPAGNVTSSTQCVQGHSATITSTFVHGRINTIRYPDGRLIHLSYDDAGRLASESGVVKQATYDAGGRQVGLQLDNGVVDTTHYHPDRDWTTSQVDRSPTKGLAFDARYAYRASGLLRSTISSTNSIISVYEYDDLDRLITVTGSDSNHYAYDAAGNMRQQSRLGSYIYPKQGPNSCGVGVPCPHPHAAQTVAGQQYRYDPAGNMTQRRGQKLLWTLGNRLSDVIPATRPERKNGQPPPRAIEHYTYDPDDQLAADVVESVPSGSKHRYYLGPLVESDQPGGLTENYTFNGQLIARRNGQTTFWLHDDRLGTTRALTNSHGQVTLRQDVTPFGTTRTKPAGKNVGLQRGLAGAPTPGTSGLVTLGARTYDPQIGRFTSPDSIDPDPTNAASLDHYAFAWNQPTSYIDPTGHSPEQPPAPGITATSGLSDEKLAAMSDEEADAWCKSDPLCETVNVTAGGSSEPGSVDPGVYDLLARLGFAGPGIPGNVAPRETTALDKVAAVGIALPAVIAGAATAVAGWAAASQASLSLAARYPQLFLSLLGVGNGSLEHPEHFADSPKEAAELTSAIHGFAPHGELAANNRTTGALLARTAAGSVEMLVSSGTRGLGPEQREFVTSMGWTVVGNSAGLHAEGPLLQAAVEHGMVPIQMYTTVNACEFCQPAVESLGGKLQEDMRTWTFP